METTTGNGRTSVDRRRPYADSGCARTKQSTFSYCMLLTRLTSAREPLRAARKDGAIIQGAQQALISDCGVAVILSVWQVLARFPGSLR